MNRWGAIVAGAIASSALALAGCASSGAGPAGAARPPAGGSPAVTSASASASAPAAAPPAGSTAVSLSTSQPVPFTGDMVPLTVQASASSGAQQWERLASATVSFGDGATASVSGRCTGTGLPPASAGLVVRHAYQRTGLVNPRLTAAAVCGQAGQPGLGPGPTLRVLPAAPAASTAWPQCGHSQIGVTAAGTGAGLGHVGVLFTLRNSSSTSCRIQGYPDVLLLGSSGAALPTTVVDAATGAYLFPAVVPHRVALAPGATASFDLQYGDNPVGAQANESYAQACPAASGAQVMLPNSPGHSVVSAGMAPCGGQVLVSPVVPGSQWLSQ